MNEFKLYFRYLRLQFLQNLQYKGWPLQLFTVLLSVASDPLDAMLMLARFGSLGGWTAPMLLAQYGLALCAFGLAELFSRGFDVFPGLIRNGSFDRILLRPRSTFVQVITLRFHLHRIGRVVGGAALMCYCLRGLSISLSPCDALMLLLALAAGALTYTAIFMIFCGLAFFTVQQLHFVNIFTNGSYQVAKVPPEYLPAWLRHTFTLIVPMFLFANTPLSAACGWGAPYWQGFLALPAAALFFLLALAIWRFGARHYQSTGN